MSRIFIKIFPIFLILHTYSFAKNVKIIKKFPFKTKIKEGNEGISVILNYTKPKLTLDIDYSKKNYWEYYIFSYNTKKTLKREFIPIMPTYKVLMCYLDFSIPGKFNIAFKEANIEHYYDTFHIGFKETKVKHHSDIFEEYFDTEENSNAIDLIGATKKIYKYDICVISPSLKAPIYILKRKNFNLISDIYIFPALADSHGNVIASAYYVMDPYNCFPSEANSLFKEKHYKFPFGTFISKTKNSNIDAISIGVFPSYLCELQQDLDEICIEKLEDNYKRYEINNRLRLIGYDIKTKKPLIGKVYFPELLLKNTYMKKSMYTDSKCDYLKDIAIFYSFFTIIKENNGKYYYGLFYDFVNSPFIRKKNIIWIRPITTYKIYNIKASMAEIGDYSRILPGLHVFVEFKKLYPLDPKSITFNSGKHILGYVENNTLHAIVYDKLDCNITLVKGKKNITFHNVKNCEFLVPVKLLIKQKKFLSKGIIAYHPQYDFFSNVQHIQIFKTSYDVTKPIRIYLKKLNRYINYYFPMHLDETLKPHNFFPSGTYALWFNGNSFELDKDIVASIIDLYKNDIFQELKPELKSIYNFLKSLNATDIKSEKDFLNKIYETHKIFLTYLKKANENATVKKNINYMVDNFLLYNFTKYPKPQNETIYFLGSKNFDEPFNSLTGFYDNNYIPYFSTDEIFYTPSKPVDSFRSVKKAIIKFKFQNATRDVFVLKPHFDIYSFIYNIEDNVKKYNATCYICGYPYYKYNVDGMDYILWRKKLFRSCVNVKCNKIPTYKDICFKDKNNSYKKCIKGNLFVVHLKNVEPYNLFFVYVKKHRRYW